jgi:hypothetical protein
VKGKEIKWVFFTFDSYMGKKRKRGGNVFKTMMRSGPFGN